MKVYVILHSEWGDDYNDVSIRATYATRELAEANILEEVWVERGRERLDGGRDRRYKEGVVKKVVHSWEHEVGVGWGCCTINEVEVIEE